MYTRIVTFPLDGLTPAEHGAHAAALAPAFITWPGLVAKVSPRHRRSIARNEPLRVARIQ